MATAVATETVEETDLELLHRGNNFRNSFLNYLPFFTPPNYKIMSGGLLRTHSNGRNENENENDQALR